MCQYDIGMFASSDSRDVVRLGQLYAESTGWTLATVSLRASGQGHLFHRLRIGHDITTRRAARIVQWFSDRWLVGSEWRDWPADIRRPSPAPDSPAAQAAAAAPEHPGVQVHEQAAATPAVTADDPIKAIWALNERINTLMDAATRGEGIDWPAVTAAKTEMLEMAMRLREDGQIASPIALCLALGVERRVYDDVVHLYAGGRSGGKRPRGEDTDRRRVFETLIDAGDVRFAARRPRTAA